MADRHVVWLLLIVWIRAWIVVTIPLDVDEPEPPERLDSGVVSLVPDELPDYVNDNPIIEMDEGERRIEMDDSGPVPVCPPAVRPWNQKLCRVKVCRSDRDCGRHSSKACCYNGCVRTCVTKLAPPAFFDWDDDDGTSNKQHDVASLNVLRGGVADRAEVEFQRPNIVLTLPGDCRLTQQQFDAFEQFKSSPNIRNCFCRAGDVFCEVTDKNSTDAIPVKIS